MPVTAGAPEQSAVVYRFTVEPGSAVPFSTGFVLGFGETGVTLPRVTSPGAVESLT